MGSPSEASLQQENVDELRQRIIEEWGRPDQRVIDNAVKQWRRRLCSCVAVKGGHFEQSRRTPYKKRYDQQLLCKAWFWKV